VHEMTTVRALCTQALEAANASGAAKVTAVNLKIGALSHLSAGHLREHFVAAAADSILEGARLDISIDEDASAVHAQEIELVSLEVE